MTQTCCLCKKPFDGYGNNPWPLSDVGRCCDRCNADVISARWADARKHDARRTEAEQ